MGVDVVDVGGEGGEVEVKDGDEGETITILAMRMGMGMELGGADGNVNANFSGYLIDKELRWAGARPGVGSTPASKVPTKYSTR